jgi:hypothetical protein
MKREAAKFTSIFSMCCQYWPCFGERLFQWAPRALKLQASKGGKGSSDPNSQPKEFTVQQNRMKSFNVAMKLYVASKEQPYAPDGLRTLHGLDSKKEVCSQLLKLTKTHGAASGKIEDVPRQELARRFLWAWRPVEEEEEALGKLVLHRMPHATLERMKQTRGTLKPTARPPATQGCQTDPLEAYLLLLPDALDSTLKKVVGVFPCSPACAVDTCNSPENAPVFNASRGNVGFSQVCTHAPFAGVSPGIAEEFSVEMKGEWCRHGSASTDPPPFLVNGTLSRKVALTTHLCSGLTHSNEAKTRYCPESRCWYIVLPPVRDTAPATQTTKLSTTGARNADGFDITASSTGGGGSPSQLHDVNAAGGLQQEGAPKGQDEHDQETQGMQGQQEPESEPEPEQAEDQDDGPECQQGMQGQQEHEPEPEPEQAQDKEHSPALETKEQGPSPKDSQQFADGVLAEEGTLSPPRTHPAAGELGKARSRHHAHTQLLVNGNTLTTNWFCTQNQWVVYAQPIAPV